MADDESTENRAARRARKKAGGAGTSKDRIRDLAESRKPWSPEGKQTMRKASNAGRRRKSG